MKTPAQQAYSAAFSASMDEVLDVAKTLHEKKTIANLLAGLAGEKVPWPDPERQAEPGPRRAPTAAKVKPRAVPRATKSAEPSARRPGQIGRSPQLCPCGIPAKVRTKTRHDCPGGKQWSRLGWRNKKARAARAKDNAPTEEEPRADRDTSHEIGPSGESNVLPFTREQARHRRARPVRAVTLSGKRTTKRQLEALRDYPSEDARLPRTRGDCEDGERPCPFVSCRHHLYLDVDDVHRSVKVNFPDLEPDQLKETCSLDVADRGGATLEDVGALMNVTRERIRQVEEKVRGKLEKRLRLVGITAADSFEVPRG